jgi:transcriptional regulator with XRE-family HTH domain
LRIAASQSALLLLGYGPAVSETKLQFVERLRAAMQVAGYAPRPAVLEREFNSRYWGKPMTLHGVRRWLLGETLPSQDKLLVLAEWLAVPPQTLLFGDAASGLRVEQRKPRWDAGIGFEDRELFEAFLRLPVPQRRVVRDVILAFSRAYSETDSALR